MRCVAPAGQRRTASEFPGEDGCRGLHFGLCIALLVGALSSVGFTYSLASQSAQLAPAGPERARKVKTSDPAKRYRWLFRETDRTQAPREETDLSLLDQLDQEIKEARRLYLSGETDNAILKYRSAIDRLESIVADIPPGHSLAKKMIDRLSIYEELVSKILGPVHLEPREDQAAPIFHLLEKRRICLRNLTLKSSGVVSFFDVPVTLAEQEAKILRSLLEVRSKPPSSQTRQEEASLKSKLGEVRKALRESSARYALLRGGSPVSLEEVRHAILGKHELILDFTVLADRLVIGVISTEKAIYYQVPVNRADIDRAVFSLQDKLKEYTYGGRSTFMGHAWKEPCRRLYRTLFGKLPPLPKEKTTVFVIPDRSLWYLPMSVLLDPEDRPFGYDRLVSFIGSADMLKLARSTEQTFKDTQFNTDLLLFESIPWIAEEQIRKREVQAKQVKQPPESEKIEQLILANPVYPKPTEIVPTIQRGFKKFEAWVGPTATVDRLLEPRDRVQNVTVLAVPLSVPDAVQPDRQPCFFFSPDKRGRRQLDAARLFADPIRSRFAIMPIAWLDAQEREAVIGEGPLLLHTALIYSGIQMGLINYSDPNWGAQDPFLIETFKKAAEHATLAEALMSYSRELPAGLDASFSGKPPTWTGWIFMGDPGR
jgi:hypothetical protein